jgi:hypothetical protein
VADDKREWYEKLLALQLRANPAIWKMLVEDHGVSERTELRLAFIYLAPGQPEAQRLLTFLEAETDYEVQARERPTGLFEKTEWLVLGATQPTAVDLETINAWVEWMVAAGAAEGPCAFDGWNAELPDELVGAGE